MNKVKLIIIIVLVIAMEVFKGNIQNIRNGFIKKYFEDNTMQEEELEEPIELEEEIKEEEELHYIDAWNVWHDMYILDDVARHPYDYKYLSGEGNTLKYEDDNYISRRGIDVSEFQGDINWNQVKEDGIEFVFVRVGYRGYLYGKIVGDKYFKKNMEGAIKAGLDVGVYFFSQAINEEEAIEEAKYVLEMIKGYKVTLPVVYDPELIIGKEARTDDVSGEQFTLNTLAFNKVISEAGYTPLIYSNMNWEAYYFDLEKLSDYEFWYADYQEYPQTPYHYEYWQYSNTGRVNGISNDVDLNLQFMKKGE